MYEQRVLSILLRHPDRILKTDLTPDDFQERASSELFTVLQWVAASGEAVDPFIVADRMKNADLHWVISIRDDYPAAVENLTAYVDALQSRTKIHSVQEILENALDECGGNHPDVGSIVGSLISRLSNMDRRNNGSVFDGRAMMKETINHLEDVFELRSEGKLIGVSTGMKKLDDLLGGFHKSDLVVVGARPGVGKTAWALSCAVNAAQQGYRVGFVSTEMSLVQVGARVTSLVSGIPAYKMRDSSFDDSEWARLTAATKTISELPLCIFDKPSCKVSDIAMQARAWAMASRLDILFVDYLTRLKPESNSENRTMAVGDMATALKTLARNLNIPVVVLAQLSRDVTKRKTPIPQASDLRDSGVIEQEADQILMLYRQSMHDENAGDDSANIIVEKNRHGDVAMLNMRFDKQTMRWCDPSDDCWG